MRDAYVFQYGNEAPEIRSGGRATQRGRTIDRDE
jgi:hypothetical protein